MIQKSPRRGERFKRARRQKSRIWWAFSIFLIFFIASADAHGFVTLTNQAPKFAKVAAQAIQKTIKIGRKAKTSSFYQTKYRLQLRSLKKNIVKYAPAIEQLSSIRKANLMCDLADNSKLLPTMDILRLKKKILSGEITVKNLAFVLRSGQRFASLYELVIFLDRSYHQDQGRKSKTDFCNIRLTLNGEYRQTRVPLTSDGFPIFDKYSRHEIAVTSVNAESLSLLEKIKREQEKMNSRYVWYLDKKTKTMQLIPSNLFRKVSEHCLTGKTVVNK